MNGSKLMDYKERAGLAAAIVVLACAGGGWRVLAQTPPDATQKTSGARISGEKARSPTPAAGQNSEDDQFFKDIYQEFYTSYRLGPGDEIAIRVIGQPDYTLERVKVSPTGNIYHPLLGAVEVGGVTIPQLVERLTRDLSEYLINPKVIADLLEANSAKIGVLGDVLRPGILVMNKPMSVLEAITASGGIADTGDKSGVVVLRQLRDGRSQALKVNVKRIIEGKARAEDNLALQAGDTVIVNGSFKKKASYILSLTGFGGFLSFLSPGRR
ncbi:MAG TPA: polysaccharide biosynthesis/export family protein [Blastocatellia bacterium]|nr:polysaccharide biosynthesis/export family protein [Blastocatellia bacterium]